MLFVLIMGGLQTTALSRFTGNTSWTGLEHSSTIPKNVRCVISYRKVHLTDFQMALWSCRFYSGAQSRANPFHLVSHTCENKH